MTPPGKRYCLIAGYGSLGSALGARLIDRGDVVYGLRRSGSALPAGVMPIRVDLSKIETLRALPGGIEYDRVFYTAAAQERTEKAYRAAYVEGPRNLLAALAGRGAPRFIYTSSTAVYGRCRGEWVDEETPAEPEGFAGAFVLEGEEIFRRAAVRRAVALRLGGIYGPGRERLIESVRNGVARIPEGGPFYTNRIHADDAARALEHLSLLHDPAGVYIGVDRDPADLGEVLRWIAARLGLPEPPEGAPPPGRGSKRCRSDRLVDSSFRFRYPTFREGYATLLGKENA